MVYEMRVRDVMTKEVITVSPDRRMSELRTILRHNRISGLPVVESGRLVGLVSVEDFITYLADRAEDCPIGERMTTDIKTVHHDDPLVLAIGKFERSGVGRFPVVDRKSGKLVGIVTKGDVIKGLLRKLEIHYLEEQATRRPRNRIFEEIEADDAVLRLHYEVKGGDFGRAGDSSSRLKRTLSRLGMVPDLVRRIAIASYEAEMNLVVFTEGGVIKATVERGAVLLEVEDSGPGIADVEKALQPGYSTASDWVRELGFGAGMGLPNIQKSSDRFRIESEAGKGTRLEASFFIGGKK